MTTELTTGTTTRTVNPGHDGDDDDDFLAAAINQDIDRRQQASIEPIDYSPPRYDPLKHLALLLQKAPQGNDGGNHDRNGNGDATNTIVVQYFGKDLSIPLRITSKLSRTDAGGAESLRDRVGRMLIAREAQNYSFFEPPVEGISPEEYVRQLGRNCGQQVSRLLEQYRLLTTVDGVEERVEPKGEERAEERGEGKKEEKGNGALADYQQLFFKGLSSEALMAAHIVHGLVDTFKERVASLTTVDELARLTMLTVSAGILPSEDAASLSRNVLKDQRDLDTMVMGTVVAIARTQDFFKDMNTDDVLSQYGLALRSQPAYVHYLRDELQRVAAIQIDYGDRTRRIVDELLKRRGIFLGKIQSVNSADNYRNFVEQLLHLEVDLYERITEKKAIWGLREKKLRISDFVTIVKCLGDRGRYRGGDMSQADYPIGTRARILEICSDTRNFYHVDLNDDGERDGHLHRDEIEVLPTRKIEVMPLARKGNIRAEVIKGAADVAEQQRTINEKTNGLLRELDDMVATVDREAEQAIIQKKELVRNGVKQLRTFGLDDGVIRLFFETYLPTEDIDRSMFNDILPQNNAFNAIKKSEQLNYEDLAKRVRGLIHERVGIVIPTIGVIPTIRAIKDEKLYQAFVDGLVPILISGYTLPVKDDRKVNKGKQVMFKAGDLVIALDEGMGVYKGDIGEYAVKCHLNNGGHVKFPSRIDTICIREQYLAPLERVCPFYHELFVTGARVRIRKDSVYAYQNSGLGILRADLSEKQENHYGEVAFDDGYKNNYGKRDLDVVEPAPKFGEKKRRAYKQLCAKLTEKVKPIIEEGQRLPEEQMKNKYDASVTLVAALRSVGLSDEAIQRHFEKNLDDTGYLTKRGIV